MKRLSNLHLEIWREVCRHIEIGESVERAVPVLQRYFPVALVLVCRVDPERNCVESLAHGGAVEQGRPFPARRGCAEEELDRLLRWCQRGQVTRAEARDAPGVARCAIPEGVSGEVLLGPLNAESGAPGVLA